MKIRIEGTVPEIDSAVERLREIFPVRSVSRLYKNRNSDLFRVYLDAETQLQAVPELRPSCHGKDCPGNGDHPGIECQCDECDYYLTCFPDWQEHQDGQR